MSDSLPLARRLSALDDDALIRLVTERRVSARDIRDFFDLADALLQPTSIRLALRDVDRAGLERLAALPGDTSRSGDEGGPLATTDDELLALALATRAGSDAPDSSALLPYEAARAVAQAILAESPAAGGGDPAGVDEVASPGDPALVAAAAERAFTTVSAVSELLQQLRSTPARLRAHGGIGTTEERRIAPVLGVEVDQVAQVVELASAARLVAAEAETLLSTTLAAEWNLLPAAERWLALTRSWFDTLPLPWRRLLLSSPGWRTGDDLARAFADRYPAADESRHEALARIDGMASTLGLVADGRPTPFGTVALRLTLEDDSGTVDGAAADSATPSSTAPDGTAPSSTALDTVASALPPEVTQVYVQHDLSVIAPGPLPPAIDTRIRLLADLENRGLASAYRISQASIDRALASGETEESLRAFLGEVSLTGMPQALDYLLTEGGRRHGLVRVRPATPGAQTVGVRSIVETSDSALRGTIALDHDLSSLDLRPAPEASTASGDSADPVTHLVSRAEPTTVYWLMLDARYPVLALDEQGRPRTMTRARILPAPTPAPPAAGAPAGGPTGQAAATGQALTPAAPAAATDLLARLRDAPAASPDDPTAWITRQLDQAVRARTPLRIDLRMPDGSAVQLLVTPQSLSNGRLRCVDEKAGIERTVPVANILAVEAV